MAQELYLQHLKIRNLAFLVETFFHSIIDSVDKRGRPVRKSAKEDLEKFYDIAGEGDDRPTPEAGMVANQITTLHVA